MAEKGSSGVGGGKMPLLAFGLLAVVIFGLWALTRGQPPRPASPETQSRTAYEVCKRGVENQLVAPDTAEFPGYEGVVVEFENRTHRFTGQVDSQNRLGVPLRLTFICAVAETTSGELRLSDALVLEP